MNFINDEDIKKVLRKNIKSKRTSLNLTQDQLAEKANISTEFLKCIENGYRLGSLTTFINLCMSLDTTPNTILYELFEDKQNEDIDLNSKINKLSKRDKNIIKNLLDSMLIS